ncbi:MAG: tyrosine-type recombinase/integrase [Bacteroidota bacterium]|nr:tyrosine-type recombinase/integrase [Bacteroidota bacterium]
MELLFYTRTKKDNTKLRIRLVDGRDTICYAKSNIWLKVTWWDQKKEKTKLLTPIDESERIDSAVEELRNRIVKAYTKDVGHIILNSAWLDSVVNPPIELEEIKQKQTKTFFELWDEFIAYKRDISAGRKRAYHCLRLKLERYSAIYGDLTTDLDASTLIKIEDFIKNEVDLVALYPNIYKSYNETIVRRGQNYANDNMKKIKTLVFWMIENGYTIVNAFKKNQFKIERDKYADPIALNEDELDLIYNAILPSYLQKVRDMFLLHCYIGARVEDFVELKRDNVDKDGILMYIASKGIKNDQKTLYVPLCDRALEIISRYNEPVKLFPFININGANGYNKTIKLVLKTVGIDRKVITINPKTGEKEIRSLCEVVTSHTARKTFVTSVLNNGKGNSGILSKMTGHVPGSKALSRYQDVQLDVLKNVINNSFNDK